MPKLKSRPFLPRPDDPAILERIRDAIIKGHPLRTAATLAGLHEDTAYGWRSRGRADLETWDGERELSSHARFVLMLKEAEAACLDRCLDPVEDQIAKGNWVTGMTLAERRFPQEFGRSQRIEIESKNISDNVSLPALPEQQLLALLQDKLASGQKLLPPPPNG